jgi:hypothetical protein
MESIERLRLGVQQWLVHHELDGDTSFFTPEEWRARGEEYCTGAKVILTFEGGLFSVMNGYLDSDELYEEFDRFVRGFGYFFELGNAWNMGFYPLGEEPPDTADFRRYAEKLRDPRWTEKRDYIRKRANNACEECGKSGCLEVHHSCYVRGWQPWEYPDYLLKCVCRDCHEQRAVIEMRMAGFLSSLTMKQLEVLRDSLANRAFYWYEKDDVLEFLTHVRGKQEETDTAYAKLRQLKKKP